MSIKQQPKDKDKLVNYKFTILSEGCILVHFLSNRAFRKKMVKLPHPPTFDMIMGEKTTFLKKNVTNVFNILPSTLAYFHGFALFL